MSFASTSRAGRPATVTAIELISTVMSVPSLFRCVHVELDPASSSPTAALTRSRTRDASSGGRMSRIDMRRNSSRV